MSRRITIARFEDPSAASAAVEFLECQGFDAAFLDHSGRYSAFASVLVARNQAPLAYSLLKRAWRGEFAEGWPGQRDEVSDRAVALTQALHGSGYKGANPVWLNYLPILWVIIAFTMFPIVALLRDWIGSLISP